MLRMLQVYQPNEMITLTGFSDYTPYYANPEWFQLSDGNQYFRRKNQYFRTETPFWAELQLFE